MAKLMRAPSRIAGAPARVRVPPKVALPFYQSPEWKALRASRMKDADYREAKRRARGGRVILDHVREIKDGGAPLDRRNTQWLTFAEHQAKTAAEKAKRVGLGAGPAER